jgi:hypothetical protein
MIAWPSDHQNGRRLFAVRYGFALENTVEACDLNQTRNRCLEIGFNSTFGSWSAQ